MLTNYPTKNQMLEYATSKRQKAISISGDITKETAVATTAGIPIQHAENADDVARAVLYLASKYDCFYYRCRTIY